MMDNVGKKRLTSAFSSPQKQRKLQHIISANEQTAVSSDLVVTTPLRDKRDNAAPASMLSLLMSPNGNNYVQRPKQKIVKEATLNDTIHGSIKMTGLPRIIMDTVEFQRLRNLRQLGTCDFVYDGAHHTRFEHSIGVCFLAEKMVRHFKECQPELNITETDILCVKVAGLCHDLGHGPFSHVFDGVFMKRMYPNKKWRHEDGSVQMFRYLIENNNIDLNEFGLSPIDKTFIEEIINGTDESERKGRPPHKYYLYDVVNNTRSGLDVDKLDYFERDMKYTNAAFACKFERFIELSRIFQADPIGAHPSDRETKNNQPFNNNKRNLFDSAAASKDSPASTVTEEDIELPYMICYPEKLVREAVELFALRFRLHQQVYTHKSVKKVEFMFTDALAMADEFIRIEGSVNEKHPDGKYRISECAFDPKALSNLDDRILAVIQQSWDERLKPAKELIARVGRRDLYVCLGKSAYRRDSVINGRSEEVITKELVAISVRMAKEAQQAADSRSAANTVDTAHNSVKSNSGIVDVVEVGTVPAFPPSSGSSDDLFGAFSQQSNIEEQQPAAFKSRTNQIKRISSITSQCSQVLRMNGAGHHFDALVILTEEDLIVEKMNIHYGQKGKNPVNNMRFFPKDCNASHVASQLNVSTYETSLPRVFEECAIRVFLRDPSKLLQARAVFDKWCEEENTPIPFPSMSQQQPYDYVEEGDDADGDHEEGDYAMQLNHESDLEGDE